MYDKLVSLNLQLDAETDQMLQQLFEKMVVEIADVRARNLVLTHLTSYRELESYLTGKQHVSSWYGAGRQSITVIEQFMVDFFRKYLVMGKDDKGGIVKQLLAIDYPFLKDAELDFVRDFLMAENRYPMFFIAKSFLRISKVRSIEIFAHANGIFGDHPSYTSLSARYGVTRERVRQLGQMSVVSLSECPLVWDAQRWASYPFMGDSFFTAESIGWEELQEKEHLTDIDLYAALSILAQMHPMEILAMLPDGGRAVGRRLEEKGWKTPSLIFSYDLTYMPFRFLDALREVGHEAALQKIAVRKMSLSELLDRHFRETPSEQMREEVRKMMAVLIPQIDFVEVDGDDIYFHVNRTNYMEEIYQILTRHGSAMTIDEIYEEFRQLHPHDHHTNSKFVRNYMLRDQRFEAVGSKSTYQLREWNRFAGSLGEVAALLLEDCDEPVVATEMCRRMKGFRPSTTLKSCNTSLYLAVVDGLLVYYHNTAAAGECVGLPGRTYPSQYWISPITASAAVSSLRRFLNENGRWPFAASKGVEGSLFKALQKYTKKKTTAKDLAAFQEGMADIVPYHYPSNERELLFAKRCREISEFWSQNHRLPNLGEATRLRNWYDKTSEKEQELDDFRRYHFGKLREEMK